eukprot:TRINITY_DN3341_c2_g1_i1.p3 TRINITY_DN3341_c2_g1~~TRINITY_DN3341_c2_g1_i1.p3  ORF type:complete len:157 (+),score=7.62 TRINITY_DN3341_c2_g1_i1:245-715(+)
MENIPYRNKALQQKNRTEQKVIVVQLTVPQWLPGLLIAAFVGKCGHMIYQRIRGGNKRKFKHGLEESDIRRHREYEDLKYHYRKRHHHKRTYSDDVEQNKLGGRRATSLPIYRHQFDSALDDSDSANEDSIYENCYDNYLRGSQPRDSLDGDSERY